MWRIRKFCLSLNTFLVCFSFKNNPQNAQKHNYFEKTERSLTAVASLGSLTAVAINLSYKGHFRITKQNESNFYFTNILMLNHTNLTSDEEETVRSIKEVYQKRKAQLLKQLPFKFSIYVL